MTFNNVVFPEPDGPKIATTSPFSTSKETLLSAMVCSFLWMYSEDTFLNESLDVIPEEGFDIMIGGIGPFGR